MLLNAPRTWLVIVADVRRRELATRCPSRPGSSSSTTTATSASPSRTSARCPRSRSRWRRSARRSALMFLLRRRELLQRAAPGPCWPPLVEVEARLERRRRSCACTCARPSRRGSRSARRRRCAPRPTSSDGSRASTRRRERRCTPTSRARRSSTTTGSCCRPSGRPRRRSRSRPATTTVGGVCAAAVGRQDGPPRPTAQQECSPHSANQITPRLVKAWWADAPVFDRAPGRARPHGGARRRGHARAARRRKRARAGDRRRLPDRAHRARDRRQLGLGLRPPVPPLRRRGDLRPDRALDAPPAAGRGPLLLGADRVAAGGDHARPAPDRPERLLLHLLHDPLGRGDRGVPARLRPRADDRAPERSGASSPSRSAWPPWPAPRT